MKDINSIELIPGTVDREVVSRLSAALDQAISLQAAVAYWCVGPRQFGPNLVKRLSGEGFLCVDVHLPTDIDILAGMVSSGANVFLYLKNPSPQPGDWKLEMPPHLLHTKLLIFDYKSEPSELWVGSHNWTARALTGVNVEASLRVELGQHSSLYTDTVNYLNEIRSKCVPFDLASVDYYKWLQGAALEDPLWVLEISGLRSTLEAHNKISVFGRSDEDYRNLRNVDRNIVVSLLEPNTTEEILYEATVVDSGHLIGSGVALDSRIYATQDGSLRPPILGPAVPPPAVQSSAKSWASIRIVNRLIGATYEVPPRERWVTEQVPDEKRPLVPDLKKWFPRPDKPLVQRPVAREVFEEKATGTQLTNPLALTGRGTPHAACRLKQGRLHVESVAVGNSLPQA
jgi:hypothetical protein